MEENKDILDNTSETNISTEVAVHDVNKQKSQAIVRTRGNALGVTSEILQLSASMGFNNPTEYFTSLIKAKNSKIHNVEDALVVMHTAADLGLGFTTVLNNVHIIPNKNGGFTMYTGIHIIRGMLLQAENIYWEKIRDYEKIYQYVDEFGSLCNGDELPDNAVIVPTYHWDKYTKENPLSIFYCKLRDNKTLQPIVVKKMTTYRFTRLKKIGNEMKTIVVEDSFSSEDVALAKLGNVHNMHPSTMCEIRAFIKCARQIAADKILNLRVPLEMAEIDPDNTLEIDEQGNFINSNY